MNVYWIISSFYFFSGIILFLLGFLILRENIKQRLHQVTGAMLVFAAIGTVLASLYPYLNYIDLVTWQWTPLGRLTLLWELFFPFLLYFSLLFPRRSNLLKNNDKFILIIFIPYLFRFFLIYLFPQTDSFIPTTLFQSVDGLVGALLKPIEYILLLLDWILKFVAKQQFSIFALLNIIYVVIALFHMTWGFRSIKSKTMETRVVLWGVRFSLIIYSVSVLCSKLPGLSDFGELSYAITLTATLVGAFSIAWAVLKYRFLSVRFVIRQGIVFTVASVILIGLYVLLYSMAKNIFQDLFDDNMIVDVDLVFFIVAVILFHPLQEAINALVNKIYRRHEKTPQEIIRDISRDILTTFQIEELKEKIVELLKQTFKISYVQLYLEKEDKFVDAFNDSHIYFENKGDFLTALNMFEKPLKTDQIKLMVFDSDEITRINHLKPKIIVPLKHRDKVTGFIFVGKSKENVVFSEQDLQLLQICALQISISLENSKLYKAYQSQKKIEEELSIARKIQRMLLPHSTPKSSSYQLSFFNIPSKEVGGDYHDFVEFGDGRLGIAIGDISGKGIPGAIMMSNLQAIFRAAAQFEKKITQVVSDVNKHMARSTLPEKYATFLYAVVDEKKQKLSFVNGGHNYPILKKRAEKSVFLDECDPVVGIVDSVKFNENSVKLESGDCLVFYSDGITEAVNENEEFFGDDRLVEIVDEFAAHGANTLCDKIYDHVLEFTQNSFQLDDMTLVVLCVN